MPSSMTILMWFTFLVSIKCSPSLYSCHITRKEYMDWSQLKTIGVFKYFCWLSGFCHLCCAELYVYSSYSSQTGTGKPLHHQLIHSAVDSGFQVFCSYPMPKMHIMIRDVWDQGFTQLTAHLQEEQFSVLYWHEFLNIF